MPDDKEIVNTAHCLKLNPHEREPLPHRRIHTKDLCQYVGGGSEEMRVIMADRRTLRRTAQRYRRATKKQKAGILDEFVATHVRRSWFLGQVKGQVKAESVGCQPARPCPNNKRR